MRYSEEHKQQSREKVLNAAAGAIRLQGTAAVSVAAIMKQAGFTHGGFYAHFKSRDMLIAESLGYIFAEQRQMALQLLADDDALRGLRSYLERYLSLKHLKNPQKGCPLPLLSGEVSRLPSEARQCFSDGRRKMTVLISDTLRRAGHPTPEKEGLVMVAEMVGAVTLARLAEKDEEAMQILEPVKSGILQRMGVQSS